MVNPNRDLMFRARRRIGKLSVAIGQLKDQRFWMCKGLKFDPIEEPTNEQLRRKIDLVDREIAENTGRKRRLESLYKKLEKRQGKHGDN
jgi:hypothetical protein